MDWIDKESIFRLCVCVTTHRQLAEVETLRQQTGLHLVATENITSVFNSTAPTFTPSAGFKEYSSSALSKSYQSEAGGCLCSTK